MRRGPLINAAFYLVTLLNGTDAEAIKEFKGVPKIIDGDTIQFGQTKLRLNGVDAPQVDQLCLDARGVRFNCGVQARERLKARTARKTWTCVVMQKMDSGQQLGKCSVDGADIGEQMVRTGWALASSSGSPEYLGNETSAKAAGLGLWSGLFVAPIDWRQHNWHAHILGNGRADQNVTSQLLSSAFDATPPSPDCAIKGNVNTQGVCIFHRPSGRWYKRITMEARRGDRWFCSAGEAVASGCRETRR